MTILNSISAGQSLVLDIGLIVAGVVGAIITLLAALLGLGWGIGAVKRHITHGGEFDFSGGFKTQEEIKKDFPLM